MTRANPQYTPAAATAAPVKAHNVVLVHGLFADGSCWSDVIARLQNAGLNVTSVQNPLTTLPEAVASAERVHRHLPLANSPAKAPDTATAGQLSSSGPGFGIFGTTFQPVGEQS